MSDTGLIYEVTLSHDEARMLRDLVLWVDRLLSGVASEADPDADFGGMDAGGSEIEPLTDPVLLRLLPNAYVDDEEKSEEFARFTRDRLAATKRSQLGAMLADLSAVDDEDGDESTDLADDLTVQLTPDAQRSWLFALGDLRLALHASAEAQESGDTRGGVAEIVDWLAWHQEGLLQTLNS